MICMLLCGRLIYWYTQSISGCDWSLVLFEQLCLKMKLNIQIIPQSQ